MIFQPKAWLHLSSGAERSRRRLRVSAAHSEWNHVGIALAAMEEGFFDAEGIREVELISFEETTGELLDREATQVQLVSEGTVDIAIDPRTTFVLEARSQSKPVCIVAARRKNHAFIVLGQRSLKSIQELRGKTVEMNQPGGATDVMMRQVLKDHNLEPDQDVKFTYSGGPMHDGAGTAMAFREGRHGPAILATETEARPLIDAGYPVLLDLRKVYPSRHDRVTAANEDFCREHPEVLKGFLKGMIRGCRFVLNMNNKERFTQMVRKAGFLTSEREKRSFDGLFGEWQSRVSRDLSLPMDGIELILSEQKRAGKIAPSFRTDEVLRLEALGRAQRELGAL